MNLEYFLEDVGFGKIQGKGDSGGWSFPSGFRLVSEFSMVHGGFCWNKIIFKKKKRLFRVIIATTIKFYR